MSNVFDTDIRPQERDGADPTPQREPPAETPPLPHMRWIPGGTFRMGSDRHYPEEAPVHQVAVDSFWMDEHEISNREFENTILTEAYALRQKGCFVVVFCGGSHLVKILSEHVLDNVGYAFLIQKNQLGPMIKTAKLLESIEEYK